MQVEYPTKNLKAKTIQYCDAPTLRQMAYRERERPLSVIHNILQSVNGVFVQEEAAALALLTGLHQHQDQTGICWVLMVKESSSHTDREKKNSAVF